MAAKKVVRCTWSEGDPLNLEYHDTEWGVPVRDDQRLFELLILEGAQAGLSWLTVLRKRATYREAFDDFDPAKVARFDARRCARLLENPGIVRNRLKVESSVTNARAFLEIQAEHGSFASYLWQFVDGKPVDGQRRGMGDVPASTPLSDALSKELKRRGFKFVGSTIIYAYLQAVGVVNDHLVSCFRHDAVSKQPRAPRQG
jgi:DNA-3-methyladenine glycosylase I